MITDHSSPLSVTPAGEPDRPVLERLWLMFRHDLSAHSGILPDPSGGYRRERLDAALRDPGWCGYLFRLGPAPVGLAVVRGLDGEVRTLSSFFLVNPLRRQGYGSAAVRLITSRHPGRWAVAYQDANRPAAAFWPAVARRADPGWLLEYRPVPGRPDLPPDTWVTFTVRGG